MHVRHDVNVKCLLQGGAPPAPPLKKGQKNLALALALALAFIRKKRQKKALAKSQG